VDEGLVPAAGQMMLHANDVTPYPDLQKKVNEVSQKTTDRSASPARSVNYLTLSSGIKLLTILILEVKALLTQSQHGFRNGRSNELLL